MRVPLWMSPEQGTGPVPLDVEVMEMLCMDGVAIDLTDPHTADESVLTPTRNHDFERLEVDLDQVMRTVRAGLQASRMVTVCWAATGAAACDVAAAIGVCSAHLRWWPRGHWPRSDHSG